MANEKGEIDKESTPVSKDGMKTGEKEKSEFLKVYESLPPRLLCAYGVSQPIPIPEVWKTVSESHTNSATESRSLDFDEAPRSGIGINALVTAMTEMRRRYAQGIAQEDQGP